MGKSEFSVAIRTLLNNKLFTVINISGLTIGLTTALLISLFVRDEVSYDSWIPAADRIYTIETQVRPPDQAPRSLARTPLEVGAALANYYSEIESVTRFFAGTASLRVDEVSYAEPAFLVDESFFDLFSLELAQGDLESVFTVGREAIVTRDLARKLFPEGNALGQLLTNEGREYRLSGILEEFPGKTHLNFEVLLYNGPGSLNSDFIDWTSARVYTYLKLEEGTPIRSLQFGLEEFIDQHAIFAPESWQQFMPSDVMDFSFLRLNDIHLNQDSNGSISPNGNAMLVYAFVGISLLIVFMANINFINLSAAKSSTRDKEIGMRKLMGASRSQILTCYLGEAMILVAIAFVFSLIAASALVNPVFQWIGLSGTSDVVIDPLFVSIAAATCAVFSLCAALYPALQLSGRPIERLLGASASKTPAGSSKFRLLLLFFQYTVSIVLMISASHFYLQVIHASSVDLGFDSDNVVSYWGLGGARDAATQQILLERVRNASGVVAATRMAQVPGSNSQNNVNLVATSGARSLSAVSLQAVAADAEFEQVLGMEILAGRSLQQGRVIDVLQTESIDPVSVVVNEIAASTLGFQNVVEAVGHTFEMHDYLDEAVEVRIIGVLENANFRSIHSDVTPMLFANYEPYFNGIVTKLDPFSTKVTSEELDRLWVEAIPEVSVFKTFLENELASLYYEENQQMQMFAIFAVLALFIAFLGIFGLAAFAVEQRKKEIGIRKVLGARILSIIELLVWQFSKPMFLAILIAWPIAALSIQYWLQSFSYRIDLAPLIFASAAACVMVLAWLTIAGHVMRAMFLNPVVFLREQ